MAYVTGNLNLVAGGTLENDVSRFVYTTTDAVATFVGAGYISDALNKGMGKGDIVEVVNLTTPALYTCQVASVTAGAATLVVVSPLVGAVNARAFSSTVILPLQLADIATGTFKVAVPFAYQVTSALFRTAKPASTTSKLATLTVGIAGTGVTGGVMALTTANQNTIGGTVAATAITALNTGTAGQTLEVTASAVTTFVEGDGWVEFTVSNLDLVNATA